MGLPVAKKQDSKEKFIVKKSLNWLEISEFFHISRTNPWNKLHSPRILKNLYYRPIVIFYVLSNNFSKTQLDFAFVSQKNSYYIHDDTVAFLLFILQKDFDICHKPFFHLLSFSSSERFSYLLRASFRSFSFVFLILVCCHFYKYRKQIYK